MLYDECHITRQLELSGELKDTLNGSSNCCDWRTCAMNLEITLWVKAVYIHRLHISTPRIAKPL